MLIKLRRASSVENFRRGDYAGQIATFLLLIMVVLLILIMVFVNIGQVALTATKVSTVADAAALSLGSQLLSRAAHFRQMLYNEGHRPGTDSTYIEGTATSPPKLCKANGILDVILGFIVAAIAILVALVIVILSGGMAAPWLVALLAGTGLIGGGIGGFIGGGLQSRVTAAGEKFRGDVHALDGALKGMAIGLAMGLAVGGACVATGVGVAAAAPQTTTSIVTAFEASAKVAEATAAGATQVTLVPPAMAPTLGLFQMVVTMPAVPIVVTVPGVVLAAALTGGARYIILKQSLEIGAEGLKNLSAAFSSFARALSGLPQPDQIKEGIILQVLSNIVDDPRMTNSAFHYDCNHNGVPDPGEGNYPGESGFGDPCDADGDGNYNESVPIFAYWWLDRLHLQKIKVEQIRAILREYIYEPLRPGQHDLINFKEFLRNLFSYEPSSDRPPGIFCRYNNVDDVCHKTDSPLVFFLRRLMEYGFWGNPEEYRLFSGRRPAPQGNNQPSDIMDLMAYNLRELDEALEELINERVHNDSYKVVSDWQFWFNQFSQAPYKMDEPPLPKIVIYGTPSSWPNQFAGLGHYDTYDPHWDYRGIQDIIVNKVANLPTCVVNADGTLPVPPDHFYPIPCKDYSWGNKYYRAVVMPDPRIEGLYSGDIQATIAAEFFNAVGSFDYYWQKLHGQRESPPDPVGLRGSLDDLEKSIWVEGVNITLMPAYYNWTDSRGKHSVMVDTPVYFNLPRMESSEKDSFNYYVKEVCFYLDHYSGSGNDHWVKVTRMDEAGKSAGLLGVWNPYINYRELDEQGNERSRWTRVIRRTNVEYGLYSGSSYAPYVKITAKGNQ